MNYEETVSWLFSQLPVFQKQGKKAYKKDLTNSINLAKYLGNPHEKFKSIHVGGTNGKGSTSHMIASILQEAGYKVGLYTSPHLKDFRERIRINGKMATKDSVVRFVEDHKSFLEKNGLSFFEMTVAMAFDYFAKEKVDIAVIEVGLGGRLDSTNIITPEVSVITNIGLDHTSYLGDTHAKIAYEKAGIIKSNVPVVIGEYQEETMPVFKAKSIEVGAELYLAENLIKEVFKTDLLGVYQRKNYKPAVQAVRLLKDFEITSINIKNGLLNVVGNTNLQGRWQILKKEPKVICDTAHNVEGLSITMNQLKKEKYDQLHLVIGVVKDKKLDEILPLLPKIATYYFCCPKIIRGLPVKELKNKADEYNLKGSVFNSVSEAYRFALENASKKDVIYIGGSTFVVAEIV